MRSWVRGGLALAITACAPLEVVDDDSKADTDLDPDGLDSDSDAPDSPVDSSDPDTGLPEDTDDSEGSGGSVGSGGGSGSGGTSGSGDTGRADTWSRDTSWQDTWTLDTSWQDTWTFDTSWGDTWWGDTSWQDTWVADTSWDDTWVGDTSWDDTWTLDTAPWGDTWWSADTGPDTWAWQDTWGSDTWEGDSGIVIALSRRDSAAPAGRCGTYEAPRLPRWAPAGGLPTAGLAACTPGVAAVLDGHARFVSVEAALAAAPEGATIDVCPGTWTVQARVRTGVTLRAANGDPARTVLTGDGRHRILSVAPGVDLRLVDLGLHDGYAPDAGGAIRALDAGRIELSGVRLVGNRSGGRGGAVAVASHGATEGPHLVLDRVDAVGNLAREDGGAVALGAQDASHTVARVLDSRLFGNCANLGGGALDAVGSVDLRIDGTQLVANRAHEVGGALLLATNPGAHVAIHGSDFDANSAPTGPALAALGAPDAGLPPRVSLEQVSLRAAPGEPEPQIAADLGVLDLVP